MFVCFVFLGIRYGRQDPRLFLNLCLVCLCGYRGNLVMQLWLEVPAAAMSRANSAISSEALYLPVQAVFLFLQDLRFASV